MPDLQAGEERLLGYAIDLGTEVEMKPKPNSGRLVTVNFPVAGICLAGPVETRDDYNRLRAEMVRLFGEPRIGHVMGDVLVEPAAAPDHGG